MTPEEEQLFGIDKLNVVRSTIPAVTHVDYSARVQTVRRETNPTYYELISRFHQLTGCPVIINTSFNVRSEPIVCTPEDAFRCFMGTELDLLVVGNSILHKQDKMPRSGGSTRTSSSWIELRPRHCVPARPASWMTLAQRTVSDLTKASSSLGEPLPIGTSQS